MEKARIPNHRELLESKQFGRLVRARWRISILLTVLLFVLYYGYILLIATNRPFVSRRLGESTTLGILLGVGVIVGAWILTAVYVAWANRRYDGPAAALRTRVTSD